MAYTVVNLGVGVQTYSGLAGFVQLSGGTDTTLNTAAVPLVFGFNPATETYYMLASDGTDASGVTAPATVGSGPVGPRTWHSAGYSRLDSMNTMLLNGTAKVTISNISGATSSISTAQTPVRPTTPSQAMSAGVALNVVFATDITRLWLQNDSGDDMYYTTVAGETASTTTEKIPPGVYVEVNEKILQANGISVFCAVAHSTNAAGGLKIKGGHF